MSPGRLKSQWQRWIGARIANRIKATVFLLTLGLLLAAGSANFAYLFNEVQREAGHELDEHVRDLSHALRQALDSSDDHIRLLSINPTVISAVLDANNQETYLFPLLQRSLRRNEVPHNICITDYKGNSLACLNSPKANFADEPWLNKAIDDNAPQAHIDLSRPAHPQLHIAYPIQFESTGTAEGVVVGEYDLVELVRKNITSNEGHPFSHVHLTSAGADIHVAGSHETSIHKMRTLSPQSAVLDGLQLSIGLGFDSAIFNAPLYRLSAIYLFLILLLAGFAFWMIGRIIPPLTHRLSALSEAASQVSSGVPFAYHDESRHDDEITQLALSFSAMTRRLQEANASLEHQVAERTTELQHQQRMLQSILDAVPGVIFQFRLRPDGTSHVPFVSQAILSLYSVSPEEVADDAAPVFARVHEDDRDAHWASILTSAEHLTAWQQEYRVVLPNGFERWLYGNALPQREVDGATLWHGIITDITEHKNAELALAESEAYNKNLFTYSHIPLVILDPDTGCFLDCNDAAVTIYGMRNRLTVMGKTPLDVSAPRQYDDTPSADAAPRIIADTRAKGFNVFEWRHQRPNGEVWDAEVRLMLFHHRGKALMQFSLRDITEQKRSEAEIWRQANFDALTGLANRSLLRDRLDRAFAQARRNQAKVGLLYLDLDGFKAINDTLGHSVGDDLLQQAAQRLKGCVREQDTAARIGGDEFVLVVHDMTERDDCQRVAECALESFKEAFQLGEETRSLSTSVGIAVYPDDAASVDALLDCADRALYQSKRTGKNRYTFHTA